MKLYTNFTKFLLFMKICLPSTFILRYMYVRAKMIVHAFMIELDQLIIIIIDIYIAHIAEASKRLETEGRVENDMR